MLALVNQLLYVVEQELDEEECPEGFKLAGSVPQPAQEHAPKSDGTAAGKLLRHGVTCLLTQVLCQATFLSACIVFKPHEACLCVRQCV